MQTEHQSLVNGTKMNPKALIFALVMSGVLCHQSIKLASEYNEEQKSLSFSKIEGKVDHIWRNSKRGAYMNRRVVYKYAVNGKSYESERETFPDRMNCSIAYSDGDKVDVYFDTADPSTCCLNQGVDQPEAAWQCGLIVGLMLISGISMTLFVREKHLH